MKKFVLLILGLVIAGFAIAAVPSDLKEVKKAPIEKMTCDQNVDAVIVNNDLLVRPECGVEGNDYFNSNTDNAGITAIKKDFGNSKLRSWRPATGTN
jgi:hypothetical protein